MNSCLYECFVYHTRLEPKPYKFTHKVFMFYLDLDEIDQAASRFSLVSRNRFNVYSFWDKDHWQAGARDVKTNILNFIRSKGLNDEIHKIYLLTQLTTWGYGFNPVSFYFCFDSAGNPVCAVPEVSNTFREMKPYYLGPEKLNQDRFTDKIVKYFYVSPFMDMDILMDFNLKVPGEKLELIIDEMKSGDSKKIFFSGITGERKALTNARLFGYGLKFPLITLKVIFLIHWHAWMLYLKKIPYFKKSDNLDLQRDKALPRK